MKFNIAYPVTGCQKVLEVDDDRKLRAFYDKRMSQEVDGDILGDEFKGYIFKVSGGNDKEGFAMKQGILHASRVRILVSEGHSCYRPRTHGERKRKSVRGCIVGPDLSVLNLVVVKKGDNEIPGLTDTVKPRRLGPKRASRIRKLFNLDKKDDVRKYVIRREVVRPEGKKPYFKAPKIQRLVTPERLQRKRHLKAVKRARVEKSKAEAEAYNKLLAQRFKEAKDKRAARLQQKRSASSKKAEAAAATVAAPAPVKAAAPAKAAAKTAAPAKASAKGAAAPSKAAAAPAKTATPAKAAAPAKTSSKGAAAPAKSAATPAKAAPAKTATPAKAAAAPKAAAKTAAPAKGKAAAKKA